MAFSEVEQQRIVKRVGGLCDRRCPPAVRDQVRLEVSVSGHDVLIEEVRPGWRDPSVFTRCGIAKLRFVRTSSKWHLFWHRASGRWESYAPLATHRALDELVQEIDRDPHGCFFG